MDLEALVRALAAVSRLLVAVPEVSELDLNPVLVSPEGATAVDVRILTSDRPASGGGEARAGAEARPGPI